MTNLFARFAGGEIESYNVDIKYNKYNLKLFYEIIKEMVNLEYIGSQNFYFRSILQCIFLEIVCCYLTLILTYKGPINILTSQGLPLPKLGSI